MKKLLSLTLALMLFLTACASGTSMKTENEAESATATNANITADAGKSGQPSETESTVSVDEKLKDFDAIISFLENDELFPMAYEEINGDPFLYDDYKTQYVDFTFDGNPDAIITVWTEENEYLPAVFVSLENGKYVYYLSDFRAAPDDTFLCEDGFIFRKTPNDYYDIAVPLKEEDARLVRNTGGSFAQYDNESEIQYNPAMKRKDTAVIEKSNGYRDFTVTYTSYYYDEKGDEHIVYEHEAAYQYDLDSMQYTSTDTETVEYNLDETMADYLVIGSNSSLNTFAKELEKTKNFGDTTAYYVKNRTKFSKNTRKAYIADAMAYVDRFASMGDFYVSDVTLNSKTYSFSVMGENPVPKYAQDDFSITGDLYIDDGESFEAADVVREGYISYKINCINLDTAQNIMAMLFDQALLSDEDVSYFGQSQEYIDVEYTNRENTLAAVSDIVYPAILAHSLDEIKSFEDSNLWKAVVIFVPTSIEYIPDSDGEADIATYLSDSFKSETLYSNDESLYMEYFKHQLVVIPMQDSVNEDQLGAQLIQLTNTGNEMELSFCVFGTLNNVKLEYTANAMDGTTPSVTSVDEPICDSRVIIKAAMPTDFSSVKVTGDWYNAQNGSYETISFILNDMMDPSSYTIITK